MKKNIHPKYFKKAQITCSCGHVIKAGATKENLKTELCSACHPFFTGTQKLVDSAGRVDKFKAAQAKAAKIKEAKKTAKKKKQKK